MKQSSQSYTKEAINGAEVNQLPFYILTFFFNREELQPLWSLRFFSHFVYLNKSVMSSVIAQRPLQKQRMFNYSNS